MWTRKATRHMRGRRSRAGTLSLPSFNLLTLFSNGILSFWSRPVTVWVSKDPSEMRISGKQPMKINKLQQNKLLLSGQHPAKFSTFDICLSSGLCDSLISLYRTSFKCCSSFSLASISLMSTAMKSSEKNICRDYYLSQSATFPQVDTLQGFLFYLNYFHTLLRDVQLKLCYPFPKDAQAINSSKLF